MGRVRVFACAGLVGVIGGGALALSFLAEARGVSPLSRVVMTSLAAEEPAAPAERPARAEGTPAEAARRRALLFQRYITEGGAARGGVLEAALFSDGQVQLRELYTLEKAKPDFVPLGVAQGKVYATDAGDLVVIDLVRGTCERMSYTRGDNYVSGPYFCQFQHGDTTSELKVYDFSRGLERTVPLPEKVPEPVEPALSPDRTKLAYSVPPGWPGKYLDEGRFRPALTYYRHLVVVDLETGRLERSAQTLRLSPNPGSKGSFEGIPLRWLDGETLLVLETVGMEPNGGGFVLENPGAYGQVVAYETKTGKTRVVTKLPGDATMWRFEFVDPGRFDVVRLRSTVLPDRVSSDYLLDAAAGEVREDPGQGCVGYQVLESPAGTQLRYGDETLDQAVTFVLVPCLETKQVAWKAIRSRRPRNLMYYEPGLAAPVEVLPAGVSEHMLWFDPEQLEPSAQPQAVEGWESIRSTPFPKPEGRAPGSRLIASAFALQVVLEKELYALHEPVTLTVRLSNVSDTDFEISSPGFGDFFVQFARRSPSRRSSGDRVQLGRENLMAIRAGETLEVPAVLELPLAGEYQVSASLGGRAFALRTQVEWRGWPDVRSAEASLRVEEAPGGPERAAAKVDRLLAQMYAETKGDPRVYSEAGRDLRDMGSAAEDRLVALAEQEADLSRLRSLLGVLARVRSDKVLPFLLQLWQREEREAKLLALEHLRTFSGREGVRAILVESLESQDPKFREQAAELVSRQWDLGLRPAFEKLLSSDDEAVRKMAADYLLALPRVNLEERIGQLLAQQDAVSFVLARHLVRELGRTTHQEKGAFPAGSWEEVAASDAARKQYREVLEAWRKWAAENPRTSASFFDRQRGLWGQGAF